MIVRAKKEQEGTDQAFTNECNLPESPRFLSFEGYALPLLDEFA